MEDKSHYVPIEEIIQQSKLLEHSTEESLRYESEFHTISKPYHSLREILSHDSNPITTFCEANSIHESHFAEASAIV